MKVDGYDLPKVDLDGHDVPEAWSHDQTCLPHLQPDKEQVFPRAVAAPEAGDIDPPERSLMGEKWADMEDDEKTHSLDLCSIEAFL